MREYSIQINNVAPGYIDVDRMAAQTGFDQESIAAGIPVGRR